MSDPFAEIDSELNVDKIKNFLKKYKYVLITILLIIIVFPSSFFYFKNQKEDRNIQTSGYFIDILTLYQKDEAKALVELEKLSNVQHEGLNFLSDMVQVKIHLKNKKFKEASLLLENINTDINKKSNNIIKKLVSFYSAQVALELNNKKKLDEKVGNLLSYGGSWALLGHEIRGHYYIKNKNYINAKKDFTKILNEQQSSNAIRARAQEMLQSINMYNETNN